MSGHYEPMPWERVRLTRKVKCSKCRRGVKVGNLVDIRHGERLQDGGAAAYPRDPTTFCIPCVTPK